MERRILRIAAGLMLAAAAKAQTSRGTVSGTVTDASGGVVTGAHVLLTQSATSARRSALTNEAGLYRFDAVDPGTYVVRVTHAGFNAFEASGVSVEANRTTVTDVPLEVGSETTAVQVNSESEPLFIR